MTIAPHNLLTILGPTASGKTRLAVALARELGGEIISADSRQVFRGMDIGTGKDLHEYEGVPHHLIDILDAGAEFSVYDFQRRFFVAFADISARGRLPILCGGTGLYLDAILRGYRMAAVPEDPVLRSELAKMDDAELAELLRKSHQGLHNTTDLLDRQRTIRALEIARHAGRRGAFEEFPAIRALVIGIRWERGELHRRIEERLALRLADGMIDEVHRLHDGGVAWERLDYYGLEYRFVGAFLRGDIGRDELFRKLTSAIRNFAKRQENWFRKMERNGVIIHWVDGAGDPLVEARELMALEWYSPDKPEKVHPDR